MGTILLLGKPSGLISWQDDYILQVVGGDLDLFYTYLKL
jgi:hypothetical protein